MLRYLVISKPHQYARGDHTHELTFDTIDNLLNNNTFTNPISITNITASGTIFGNQIIGGSTYYDNAGNLVAYGDDRNSIIIQTSNNSNDAGIAFRNNGGAVYPYTTPGIASLTSSTATTSPDYYYYLYDWDLML